MLVPHPPGPGQRIRRAGFTLVELLIVIAIIGILATLTAGAAVNIIAVQRVGNTERTVRKAAGMVEKTQRAAIENALEDAKKPGTIPEWMRTMAEQHPDRTKVIFIKDYLRREFPVNFGEINADPQSPYRLLIEGSSLELEKQSSACLFLALTTRSRRNVNVDADIFSSTELADTDKADVKVIVDAWGKPLRFYRWPTGNEELNPPSGSLQSGFKDPVDPLGTLSSAGWNNRSAFISQFHGVGAGQSYDLRPVIVSAGRDGEFGLDTSTMSGVYSDQGNDNIYSNRLR